MISTERFILRQLDINDCTDRYLSWLRSSEVSKFIVTAEETKNLLELKEYVKDKTNDDSVLFLAIIDKETGFHIGNIKYEPLNRTSGFSIMGIFIGDKSFHGKGVAGEVIKASATYLKSAHGIDTIILGVESENIPAVKAYAKIGFVEFESKDFVKRDGGIWMKYQIK